MKTLVLGLGNEILSDDGVGLYVARELKKAVSREDITISEASIAGLGLLDILNGYDMAIIIDAIQTKEGKPGQVYRLEANMFDVTRHTASTHNINFASALDFGSKLGLALPKEIIIFAVEAADVSTFGEECTPEVAKAIPECVDVVLKEIRGEK